MRGFMVLPIDGAQVSRRIGDDDQFTDRRRDAVDVRG